MWPRETELFNTAEGQQGLGEYYKMDELGCGLKVRGSGNLGQAQCQRQPGGATEADGGST